jgi:hypothetical protein
MESYEKARCIKDPFSLLEQMMLNKNYGIGAAALAVQSYIESRDGIEPSWNKERGRYDAEPRVAPWYNGRERGIVIYMNNHNHTDQINIAIYEHRNSDNICALMWRQKTYINPPCLATLPEDVFKDKWDVTESWSYYKAVDAASWVVEQLEEFWTESVNPDAAA